MLDADLLYNDAPCGLLLTTTKGAILRVNQTFCRWSGHSAEALTDGRTFQSLLTVGGKIFHQTHWTPLLQMQGSVAEVKLDLVHADGTKIPFVMNAQRREWQGEAVHEIAVFVAKDRHKYEVELIKARKRAEAAETTLQAAHEALKQQADEAETRARFAEQMMGIVGHDLRNPLNVLKLLAQLLSAVPVMTDDKRKDMSLRMQRSVQIGERLIADMLDFTAARLGKGISVVLTPVDLTAVVENAVADMAVAHPGRNLRHVARGDAPARADADRIVQVVVNLVSNALTYGAADQPVEVRTFRDGGETVLEVANGGDPIASELLLTIFEPMTRGQVESSRRSVGLGLFIVSEIVRMHGGAVAVKSEAASGTVFTVRLPGLDGQP